jgi:hypothetical protein
VLTGRAVVVTVKVELRGLLLFVALKANGFVEKLHAAPAGNPAEQDNETLLGKLGIGVAVTWYVAEVPAGAGTVKVLGLTAREKSVTVTLSGVAGALLAKLGSNAVGAALTVPVFVKPAGNGTVGVKVTVTVAVVAICMVPIEHCTAPLTGDAQLPGEALMELKVTPETGRVSVKTTPVAGSGPTFVTL